MWAGSVCRCLSDVVDDSKMLWVLGTLCPARDRKRGDSCQTEDPCLPRGRGLPLLQIRPVNILSPSSYFY